MKIRTILLTILSGLLLMPLSFGQERELLPNGMFKVNNAGRFGLQDENGNVIVSAEYDTLDFHNGIAIFIKEGKVYGRINDDGERVMFEKPYFYSKKYPFYSEGYLVVGRPAAFNRNKTQWLYVDESGAQINSRIKFFNHAEPFIAGYAVVRTPSGFKHIDMVGNEHFIMNDETVIHRSAVYWAGGDNDRPECVIITDKGIHICQEDGDKAVIKETLYRGNALERYLVPDSFCDSSGGVLLFNKYGQAEVYDDGKGTMRWLIPLP